MGQLIIFAASYQTHSMIQVRRIAVILTLLIFSGYYAGVSLFYHVHVIDGAKIVHSHPFSGDASDHRHNQNELVYYQFVNHMVFAFLIVFVHAQIKRPFFAENKARHQLVFLYSYKLTAFQLRGPPVV